MGTAHDTERAPRRSAREVEVDAEVDADAEAAARRRHPASAFGPRGPAAAVFAYDVDDVTYRHDQPRITGGEIMDGAGIPRAQGLVRRHDDGTTTAVAADDLVYLVRGLHFRRRPRFKRG
jgi:hypothetical protein